MSKRSKKIIGGVNKNQLFSLLEDLIELKNYGNKIISKNDLEKVVMYDNQNEIILTDKMSIVKDQTKIEE